MRRFIVILTLGLAVTGLAQPAGAQEPAGHDAGAELATPVPAGEPTGDVTEVARIRRMLDEGQPARAVRAAARFERRRPDSPRMDEVLYLAGQAQMDRNRYWAAHNRFERLLSRYPTSEYYERALHEHARIADAFLAGKKRELFHVFRIGARAEGVEIHQRVAERVPGSRLASDSLMTVGHYHFRRSEWEEAADTFRMYVELFRGYQESEEAAFLAALAIYRSFQGPAFDDTPMVEAEQLFRQYQAQYPRQAQQRGVQRYLDSIAAARAQKDLDTARFYERTGRARAAATYYREVIRLYPDTPQAAASRQVLLDRGEPLSADQAEPAGGLQ